MTICYYYSMFDTRLILREDMKLNIQGNTLIVDPWLPSLDKKLKYSRRVKDDSSYKLAFKYQTEKLYQLTEKDGRTIGITYTGFLSTILEELRESKKRFKIVDERPEVPEPDFSRLESLRKRQDKFLATLISSQNGILEAPTGLGKSFLIVQVTRIYPQLNILIISTAKDVVESLYERIEEGNPEAHVSQCRSGKKPKKKSKVIVCSAGSIHHIDPDWPDMVIFDECHGAGARNVCIKLTNFVRPRMFGVSASPKGRTDGSDKEVQALFGDIIFKIDYDQAARDGTVTPLKVYWVDVTTDTIDYDTPVAQKRWGYWRNDARNQAIAKCARALDEDKQVLIMVATVEHALWIRKYLPDYKIVHKGITEDKWERFEELELVSPEEKDELMTVDTEQLRHDFKSGKEQKVIATLCWKEGVDFPDLERLIRADAQSSSIPSVQIAGRLSRISGNKKFGILVDFNDNYGEYFRRRSQERKRQYEKKRWTIKPWQPKSKIRT